MSLELDLQVASDSQQLPVEDALARWAEAAIAASGQNREETELSVRIVDIEEGTELNQTWRGKQGPTNVLSFPTDFPSELALPLIGDLVICAPMVEREAREQAKTLEAHWAHMVVHGTLHLLGYDHIEETDALEMEALETHILTGLGYPTPYAMEVDLQEPS